MGGRPRFLLSVIARSMAFCYQKTVMKEIPITRGYIPIVDDADYEFLMQWKWSAVGPEGGPVYAVRQIRVGRKTYLPVRMHRLVLGVPEGNWVVDHINHDTLDNRKQNLRLATHDQSAQNRRSKRNKSGYRGVYKNFGSATYLAVIQCRGRRITLGNFRDPIEAAKAYDEAAKRLHGRFAVVNFLEAAPPTQCAPR